MKNRFSSFILLSTLLTVPAVAQRGMILQAQPKATAAAAAASDLCDIFYVCSLWHEQSPEYCTVWHVVYCGPATLDQATGSDPSTGFGEKALAGRKLTIENQSEVRQVKIQRLVPQYHLASGAVVEPQGSWNPNNPGGEEWREVRPLAKQVFRIANWEDVNADGLVGVGDRVVFKDGRQSQIKAVRLGVHVEVTQSEPRQ
jgi:hypothetical protein